MPGSLAREAYAPSERAAPVYNCCVPDPSNRERAALGEVAFEEAWEQGRAMSFEQAAAYALLGTATPEGPDDA